MFFLLGVSFRGAPKEQPDKAPDTTHAPIDEFPPSLSSTAFDPAR
jgi:hypothetical protein